MAWYVWCHVMTSPTEQPTHAAEISTPAVAYVEPGPHQKPCCARITGYEGGWCGLPVAHDGPCHGALARPTVAPPPPDRRLMSIHRADLSLKWNTNDVIRAQWYTKWGLKP